MSESEEKPPPKWHHPSEVMRLYNLKRKKKALQARIQGAKAESIASTSDNKRDAFEDVLQAKKRRNPFIKSPDSKRQKSEPLPESQVPLPSEDSTEPTLFKLLNSSTTTPLSQSSLTSFENILSKAKENPVVIVKGDGITHPPVDWTLKTKMRLWSPKPFPWNYKLKIGEEASGTTGFVRCLDKSSDTKLDTSPNSNFHQCCHYWQHPVLPWLSLFPRKAGRTSEALPVNASMRTALQAAWIESLRSLFHLIRTKQCPYFYMCSNTFTVLFRAAGICGFADVHALITPTSRGFRQVLKDNDIEFTTPLKKPSTEDLVNKNDQGYETMSNGTTEQQPREEPEDQWMKSMGIDSADIKQINCTQGRIDRLQETEIDNQEESLVLVEGVEVNALHNFLLNCKSATSTSGTLAGIPPTLLAPVAFNGATLQTLKVRENKIKHEGQDFFSLELAGPILPTAVHSVFGINGQDASATFTNLANTQPFNKVTSQENTSAIFNRENLIDCGLSSKILDYLCKSDVCVATLECLRYKNDTKTYTWT